MHEKDARLASGRWAVVHGYVAPGSDLDGLDEEAGFQRGGDGVHQRKDKSKCDSDTIKPEYSIAQ